MYLDPWLPTAALTFLLILFMGIGSRRVGLPSVVAYLIGGVLLGEHCFGIITDEVTIERLGSFGVILLLFFAGMEIDVAAGVKQLVLPFFATLLQVGFSIVCIAAIGIPLGWPPARIFLLGCVISLSGTAVVINILEEYRATTSNLGRNLIAILLMQDIAVVPMFIVLGLLTPGESLDYGLLIRQCIGAILVGGAGCWIVRVKSVSIPFLRFIRDDRELQLFGIAGLACGLAYLTAFSGLSTAVGAFLAGFWVSAARETGWVSDRLHPLRTLCVGAFFVSIGMLLDLNFFFQHWLIILILVALTFAVNTGVNYGALRLLRFDRHSSIDGGILLSQLGEFSFILAAVGRSSGIISDVGYNYTIVIIALSLILSPVYFVISRPLIGPSAYLKRREECHPIFLS